MLFLTLIIILASSYLCKNIITSENFSAKRIGKESLEQCEIITMKLIILLLLITYCEATIFALHLVILDARRVVDLTSQLVRTTTTLKVQNKGRTDINHFGWIAESGKEGNLSYITVKCGDKNTEVTKKNFEHWEYYEVSLLKVLYPGDIVNLNIEEIYIKSLVPFPDRIKQKDSQFVLYEGNIYLHSPYAVVEQDLTVIPNSKKVESYTKFKPFQFFSNKIEYGPYKSIGPFSYQPLKLHYENNNPFLTVSRLLRTIEISHWGGISVVEEITIRHTGAKLKGEFSRFDLQHYTNNGPSSVHSYITLLPASAENIFYRDDIGNISTSQLTYNRDSVEMQIGPRFPLFGGWKTVYTIGYSVPCYEYLFFNSDNYFFTFRLIDHILDEMYVKSLTTRIILPPGVQDIKLKLPYKVKRLPDTLAFKPLDPIGRTVINLSKKNLVDAHIQAFELEYVWSYTTMLYSVLRFIGAIYFMFLCYIVYNRLDFSIPITLKPKKM